MKDVPRERPIVATLRNQELQNAYLEANSEYDDTWEIANSDGLPDEEC
jgi:hypothetical protein